MRWLFDVCFLLSEMSGQQSFRPVVHGHVVRNLRPSSQKSEISSQ